MTIIVSVSCNDGVVIGCDGMASSNIGNMNFVGIDNLKIEIIKNIIVACAGDDGLMALFINYLTIKYDESKEFQNSDELVYSIVNEFYNYCNNYYLLPIMGQSLVQIVNNIPVIIDPIKNHLITDFYKKINENFDAIIAFELKGQSYIYTLKGFQTPIMMRDKGIWYKIIGSGCLIGLPSIHLIKNILNIKEKPSIEKAIQLVYWTINHAIETSSGGIGGNIKIIKLAKSETSTEYNIENVDLTGTKEYIKSVYDHIHLFFDKTPSNEINKAPALPQS